MDTADIDVVDYAVLTCLDENGATWKKRMYTWIQDRIDELPGSPNKSVQTIGRRADQLHEDDLIETCIMSPDAVDRDMIIGYRLSADGEKMLEAKRNEFLRDMVVQASEELLTGKDSDVQIDREPLVNLLVDAFDIDAEIQADVLPQITTTELVGLLATHFFLDNAGKTFNLENTEAMVEFLERTPQFRRPFEDKNIITRLREKLAARLAPDQHIRLAGDSQKEAVRRQ